MIGLPTAGLEAFAGPLLATLGLRHGGADSIQLFVLALARWLPIVAICPFLGGRLVPAPVRMGLGALLALFVLPHLSATLPAPLALDGARWWLALLQESFVGVVLGLGSGMVFWAADSAGRFLDSVRGTTTANLMIPQVQVQTSLLGDFYFQLFVVLYVLAGGHRIFLAAVFESYGLVPPLARGLELSPLAASFIGATGGLLGIAVKLVAPALAIVILMDLVLGVANRMAPQLDVYFLSLSLKSSLSSFIVALSLYSLLDLAPGLFRDQHRWMEGTLRGMNPRPVAAGAASTAATTASPAGAAVTAVAPEAAPVPAAAGATSTAP